MGIIPLQFAQKIQQNYRKHQSDDSIKLRINLNENLRLFYMGYQKKLCKNCAKIYKTVFQRVENR